MTEKYASVELLRELSATDPDVTVIAEMSPMDNTINTFYVLSDSLRLKDSIRATLKKLEEDKDVVFDTNARIGFLFSYRPATSSLGKGMFLTTTHVTLQ